MIKIINQFCPQIDEVRDSFLASGFGTWTPNSAKVGSGVYEGVNFVGEHKFILASLMVAMNAAIIPCSMFARSTNTDTERAYIHSDRTQGDYTCITYLSDHQETSGTAFYRHRDTGLYGMPLEWMDDEQRAEEMVIGDDKIWQQLDFVRGIYNRALIFEASLFHSRFPMDGIGKDPETGRLVHVTHFMI